MPTRIQNTEFRRIALHKDPHPDVGQETSNPDNSGQRFCVTGSFGAVQNRGLSPDFVSPDFGLIAESFNVSLKKISSVRCRTDGFTLAAYRELLDQSMFDANQAEKYHQGAPCFLC